MIKTADIIQGYREGKVDGSTLIKMASFREELEKSATFWDTLKGIMKSEPAKYMMAGTAAGTVASAIHEGIKSLEGQYHSYKLSHEKEPAFQAMLGLHPTLRENESRAKLYFDALWHFSPDYAQEPLSAGAYIRQALSMDNIAGGPMPEFVDKTVQIAKAYTQSQEKSDGEGTLGNIFMPIKTLGTDVTKTYVAPSMSQIGFNNVQADNDFKKRFATGKPK